MPIIEELEKICKQCTLVDELVVARTIEALLEATVALESCHEYYDDIQDESFSYTNRQIYNKDKVKLALRLLNE